MDGLNNSLEAMVTGLVDSLPKIIAALVVFILTLLVAGLVARAAQRAMKRRGVEEQITILLDPDVLTVDAFLALECYLRNKLVFDCHRKRFVPYVRCPLPEDPKHKPLSLMINRDAIANIEVSVFAHILNAANEFARHPFRGQILVDDCINANSYQSIGRYGQSGSGFSLHQNFFGGQLQFLIFDRKSHALAGFNSGYYFSRINFQQGAANGRYQFT